MATKRKKNINVPNLRFPEFKEEQNSYRRYFFRDIFLFSTGRNIKQSEASYEFETPCIRYGELYHMYGEVITEVINKTNLDKSSLIFSDGDEILLPSAGEDPLDIGSASALTVKNVAIGRTINILKPAKPDIFSQRYVAYYINHRLKSTISTLAKGVSISNVYNSDLKTLEVILPNLDEQNKVAHFLSLLENRIRTQNKIIEKCETLMLCLREKLMTQKIQFTFEKDNVFSTWEKKRLDSIILQFIVPMRDKPKDLNGEIPWCRIEDFSGKYLSSSKSGQGVSKQVVNAMNLKIYPINTLIVSCSANLGFCAIVKRELITNQTFIGLVPDESKISIEYLYYAMKSSAKKLNILSSGTTISYLSREQFEKFEIDIPQLSEQNKIANCLSSIDNKIETEKQILARYELQKKHLLQNLFI